MTGCSGVTWVGLVSPPEGEVGIAMCNNVTMRVYNTPGKPRKSWNFGLEICLTQAIKFLEFMLKEMYVDCKENLFKNPRNGRI